MEFNEKLRELRTQKQLTQEELASALFVSRTAVSKWESGRGYPNIESLKAIAVFFSVSVDELLSTNELLNIAEDDSRVKEENRRTLVCGLLDVCSIMLVFLPLFAQRSGEDVLAVRLTDLRSINGWLLCIYFAVTGLAFLTGVISLALQGCSFLQWQRARVGISVTLSAASVLLFVMSLQPYAAAFSFVLFVLKVFFLVKKK